MGTIPRTLHVYKICQCHPTPVYLAAFYTAPAQSLIHSSRHPQIQVLLCHCRNNASAFPEREQYLGAIIYGCCILVDVRDDSHSQAQRTDLTKKN